MSEPQKVESSLIVVESEEVRESARADLEVPTPSPSEAARALQAARAADGRRGAGEGPKP